MIRTDWKWLTEPSLSTADGTTRKLDMTVTVPPNVIAEIHVPTTAGTLIEDSSLGQVDASTADGVTILTKGSGTHHLISVVTAV